MGFLRAGPAVEPHLVAAVERDLRRLAEGGHDVGLGALAGDDRGLRGRWRDALRLHHPRSAFDQGPPAGLGAAGDQRAAGAARSQQGETAAAMTAAGLHLSSSMYSYSTSVLSGQLRSPSGRK